MAVRAEHTGHHLSDAGTWVASPHGLGRTSLENYSWLRMRQRIYSNTVQYDIA